MTATVELLALGGRPGYVGHPISILLWVACLIGCVLIGRDKNRLVEGVLLGVFCGCIGLVIMAVLPAKR